MATSDVSISSKTVYEWANGYRARIDATTAYKELERIRKKRDGELRPPDVLDAARSPRSKLHPAFNWDDESAAEKWRLHEATNLIISIRVVELQGDDKPSRAFVYAPATREPEETLETGGFYVTPKALLEDERLYLACLERARGLLKSFRTRYEFLTELKPVLRAIDELPD